MRLQDKTALYVLGLPPLQLLSQDLADAWARFCGWLSACEPEIKSHLANGIDYWLELQGMDIPMNEYHLDQVCNILIIHIIYEESSHVPPTSRPPNPYLLPCHLESPPPLL